MSEVMMPKTIKWLRGLSIAQVAISVLGIVTFTWLATLDHTTLVGFWKGFSNGVNGGPITPEDAGALSAAPLVVLICAVLILVAVKKRSKGFWYAGVIVLGLVILSALAQVSIPPLLPLVIFVLAIVPSSREYIGVSKKRREAKKETETK